MRFGLMGLTILAMPAMAGAVTFPVSVPQECVELALREGVPIVMQNKFQATRARLKLASLRNSDPLVRECRAAVASAMRAAEHSGPNGGQK